MGEAAEMALDGTVCEWCGQYLDDEDCGHPRKCKSCQREADKLEREKRRGKKK